MGLQLQLLGAVSIGFLSWLFYHFSGLPVPEPERSPIVSTAFGQLQGLRSTSRDGRPYFEFRGIPYAKPPIGRLRYEPPEPPEMWQGVRRATEFGNKCPQFYIFERTSFGDEDCLLLHVYTPAAVLPVKMDTAGELLPVMVFIHGGGFMFGSGELYRPDYFMDEDVVLVLLNYRLGSLGFLNSGPDGAIRGNMGLKDQVAALKWVQGNVAAFGGDKRRVTIFGESAGGASVHLQLLSPMARGLFHRAISQSGTALAPWAIKPWAEKQARDYASRLNCTRTHAKEMVNCLKTVPIDAILSLHSETGDIFRGHMAFYGPTIETVLDEHTFLSEQPKTIIESGQAAAVPYITGYNSHEGLLFSADLHRDSSLLKTFTDEFNDRVPAYIFYPNRNSTDREMSEIKEFYFGVGVNGVKAVAADVDAHTDLYTDWTFALSAQETATLHSKHGQSQSPSPSPTYLYYYSYQAQFAFADILVALNGRWSPTIEVFWYKLKQLLWKYALNVQPRHYGAGHTDELSLLFKIGQKAYVGVSDVDYVMSKELVKTWVGFARNEVLAFKGMEWPAVDSSVKDVKVFEIGKKHGLVTDPNAGRTVFLKKYHFW